MIKTGPYALCFVLAALALAAAPAAAAVFQINYLDAPGTGFHDPLLGPARREAFSRACDAWGRWLVDETTITVDVGFASMGGSSSFAAYGAGGPTRTFRAFTTGIDRQVWYPSALADALAGYELKSGYADIRITFNSDIDGPALGDRLWHYDASMPANDDLDFQTAAMHEIGHGLGFYTSFQSSGEFGQEGGYPVIFDTFLASPEGVLLIDLPTDRENVRDEVYFLGSQAQQKWLAEGKQGLLPVYAPGGFSSGSSLVHWDPVHFHGDLSLMRPYFDQSVRVPDNITLGALADMGWTVDYPHAPEPSVILILAGGGLIALRRRRKAKA
jgi:hypothetical protein